MGSATLTVIPGTTVEFDADRALWVDGELLVDEWHVGRGEYHSPATYLSSGYHEVVIEYFEDSGEAEIRYWYE